MLTRKRKLPQASREADGDLAVFDHASDAGDHHGIVQLEKEQEIWEAFREEHHEAIEQLPLTLHRQYTLLEELDQQVAGHMGDLLSILQTYVSRRRELARRGLEPATSLAVNEGSSSPALVHVIQLKHEHTPSSFPVSNLILSEALPFPRQDFVISDVSGQLVPKTSEDQKTTRQMLRHIASLTGELLRASEEKVNVAQAVHDSVDRHVRILELAIQEQESAITLGSRPGHLAPNLPDLSVSRDLTVPRRTRPFRTSLSPMDSDDIKTRDAPATNGDKEVSDSVMGHGKKKGRAGRPKQDGGLERETPLTITLPAQPAVADAEERYCYCNQVSFGEMIACDGKKCAREWFHLNCAGLEVSPEDGAPWYCRDCRPAPRRKRK